MDDPCPNGPLLTRPGSGHLGFFYMVFGPAGNRPLLGVWAAPAAQKNLPEGEGLRPTPFRRVFGAAWAAQTQQIGDFRPAQKAMH
jgi:hypothetical protein